MFGSTKGRLDQFGAVFQPQEAMQPILARSVRSALMEWLTEIWAEAELTAVGIAPRRRAIFLGAPGTGKTTLAHHIAARLGLTMLAVRPEALVSKWVNETANNLGALFDLCDDPDDPVLLFIDEFDALSGHRRKAEQAADVFENRQVDILLQWLEQHRGFVIAATNHADHIDQAIWRRFDVQITLDLPGQEEREAIFARYLAPYRLGGGDLKRLGEATETASPALIRKFCEGLKRQFVLGPKLNLEMGREAVIGRLLTTVHPHPDCGKPRLWSLGPADNAIRNLPWPLSQEEPAAQPDASANDAGGATVISFGARP